MRGLGELSEESQDTVRMAAHDLRNDLHAIKGFAEVCAAPSLDVTTRMKCASRIGSVVNEMTALLSGLMNGLEGKALDPSRRRVCVMKDLVEAAVRNMGGAAWEKGVTLRMERFFEAIYVHADKDQIARVMANLLSNAVKFASSGGSISVRIRRVGTMVRVEVQDDGIGIAPENQPRVFEKFFQVQPHNHGSLGLGLYIAQEFIRAHGGEISVESGGLGCGSTFWFALPYLYADLVDSKAMAAPAGRF